MTLSRLLKHSIKKYQEFENLVFKYLDFKIPKIKF